VRPRKQPKFVSTLPAPAFFFSEEEMRELVAAFYFGKSQRFASRLERLDNAAWIQGAKAIVNSPEDMRYGNKLLGEFTHQQVLRAIKKLKSKDKHVTKGYGGFWEYCLRAWVGKTNPNAKCNISKPAIEDADILRALIEFTHCLHGERQRLDSQPPSKVNADLKKLVGKLALSNHHAPKKELCHV